MKTKADRWHLILNIPYGHRFFRDLVTGKVAVADRSGKYPDETEDGILWLNTTGDKLLTVGDHKLWIPLTSESTGKGTSTTAAAGDVFLISSTFDMPVLDRHDKVWLVERTKNPWD